MCFVVGPNNTRMACFFVPAFDAECYQSTHFEFSELNSDGRCLTVPKTWLGLDASNL